MTPSDQPDAARLALAEPAGRRGPVRADALRRHNLVVVLDAIAASESPTRAQVAEQTGLTKASVSTLTDSLIGAGLVVELDPERRAPGRPGNPLALDPAGPAGLGIEVNVDYVSACVVDFTGAARAFEVVAGDNRGLEVREVLERAAGAARRALGSASSAGLGAVGFTVAVPGIVDRAGVLRRAPNLPGWEEVAVASRLAGLLGEPAGLVSCDNEANLAALAELWLGEGDRHDFIHVSGEVGIGAGIVVAGRIWRGARGLGGELGHVVVDPAGPRCGCGARGCLEAVAGQDALLRAVGVDRATGTALGSPDGPARLLVERARAGDAQALGVLEVAGHALGVALAGAANLVDVPAVVLGGLYAVLAPYVAGAVRDELTARVVGFERSPVEVSVSSLGASAAVRGAALSVVRAIRDDPAAVLPGALALA